VQRELETDLRHLPQRGFASSFVVKCRCPFCNRDVVLWWCTAIRGGRRAEEDSEKTKQRYQCRNWSGQERL